jgi:hypothetical protein
MTKLRAAGLLALLAITPFAAGQMQMQGQGTIVTQGPAPVQAVPQPTFESLAKAGPDGKIVRLDGILDLMALQVNPKVDAATIERSRPAIKEWMTDVDLLTIENLDFIERIMPLDGGPGMIEKFDIRDTAGLTTVAQMMTHLMAAGPLVSYLENRGVITREQSQLNQQITSDYLQRVMNELMDEQGLTDLQNQNKTEEERTHQTNVVSRFLYGITCRDTMESYKRILVHTAPNADKALAAIGPSAELQQKTQGAVSNAKSARTVEEKRAAVREIMKSLDFDQRREFLEQGRALAGEFDPFQTHAGSEPRGDAATASR